MYGRIVNDDLKEVFCEFDSGTLLKLAYKMRGGKSVSLKDILKMDKDLAQNVLDLFFEDEGLYVTLEAQANWKVLLDRVINGQLDGAHMLALPEKVA